MSNRNNTSNINDGYYVVFHEILPYNAYGFRKLKRFASKEEFLESYRFTPEGFITPEDARKDGQLYCQGFTKEKSELTVLETPTSQVFMSLIFKTIYSHAGPFDRETFISSLTEWLKKVQLGLPEQQFKTILKDSIMYGDLTEMDEIKSAVKEILNQFGYQN